MMSPNNLQSNIDAMKPQAPEPAQPRVNLNTDVIGLLEVVSTVPAGVPHNLYDQIKVYTNGTTYRLYWYDQANRAWRYASGT